MRGKKAGIDSSWASDHVVRRFAWFPPLPLTRQVEETIRALASRVTGCQNCSPNGVRPKHLAGKSPPYKFLFDQPACTMYCLGGSHAGNLGRGTEVLLVATNDTDSSRGLWEATGAARNQ